MRFAALAVVTVSIGACAGPRKGADAGGGPAPTGGSTGGSGTGKAPPGGSTASGTGAPTGNTTPAPPSGSGAAQGQPCDDGNCAPGLACVSYYGFAGAAGPKFTSCEIRCQVSGKPGCPVGQNCITIADGPGTVCRPSDM